MKRSLFITLFFSFCIVSLVYANSNFADYQYQVDYFEIIGNQPSNLRDEFDDEVISPWYIEEETVSESGSYLNLSTPGILFGPYEINGASWISERSSVRTDDAPGSGFDVAGGAGDFTATSKWKATIPSLNEFYGMELWSRKGTSNFNINLNIYNFEPYYANALGIPSGMGIWLLIDTGDPGALSIQAVNISEITGNVILRLDFNDETDSFLASYSTNGGTSFNTFSPVSFNLEIDDMEWYLEAEEWKIPEPVNCKYLIDGDFNRDCKVDFADFSILALNWLVDCDEFPLDPACRCDIPWVAEAPMIAARDQFAGGVIDGKIYVFGGNGNSNGINLKSTEGYNPATMRWSKVANNEHNGGMGVEELTAAVVDNKLYVFGGWGGTAPDGYYGVFNFNEMYDPATNSWTTLAQRPTTVAAAPTTVYNNEIYLFGGYFDSDNASQDHEDYDVVECYDPNTNTWRFVTNMPQVMTNFGLATIGHKAFLFGGYVPGSENFRDEVIAYDFQDKTWTTTGYQPIPTRKAYMYSVSAPVIDRKVYLIGGGELIEGEYVYDRGIDIYNPLENTWEEGIPLPLPLCDHVTLNIGGTIYVLGGDHNADFENRAKAEVISLDTEFCSK